jgi:hypothetical protein
MTRCFSDRVRLPPVLVDQFVEDSVASDRGVKGDRGGGVVGWWVLVQALVRAVVIEVVHANPLELTLSQVAGIDNAFDWIAYFIPATKLRYQSGA